MMELRWMRFKSNWQCPFMLKNGFSTLGYVNYFEHTNKLLDVTDSVWDNICRCNKFYHNKQNESLKTFVVWRDPYKRILSLYMDCCSDENNHQDLYKFIGHSRKDVIDNPKYIIQYCENNFKTFNDWHVTSQVTTLSHFNYKIDTIVMLNDLPRFIEEELNFKNVPIINKSVNNIDISKFESFKNEIENLYKDDYELLNLFKNKIYK